MPWCLKAGRMSSTSCAAIRPLPPKRSPEDILQLFNTAPGNQLFAGSPAQDQFFQTVGTPLVSKPTIVHPHGMTV